MTAIQERPPLIETDPVIATPHERHFGNLNFQTLDLDSLIVFAQIREKANERISELEESIDCDDLDNPINVARLDEAELRSYITFTNKTWRRTATFEDFEAFQQPDGLYNVVVAGHSRTQSMRSIANRHTADTGQPTNYTVLAKIEVGNTVREMVRKQYVENIHAAVPPERAATAIVEMYQFGLGTDWNGPEEFYQMNKKHLSKPVLDKALTYGQLPQQLRDLVDTRYLAYATAIELGKAAKVIRMHKAAENGLEINETLPSELEQAVAYRLMGDAVHIYKEKLRGAAAKRYIESFVKRFQDETSAMLNKDKAELFDDMLEIPEFHMVSAYEQTRAALRKEQRRLESLLRDAATKPHQSTTELMLIVTEDDKEGVFDGLLEDSAEAEAELNERLARRQERTGQLVLASLDDELLAVS